MKKEQDKSAGKSKRRIGFWALMVVIIAAICFGACELPEAISHKILVSKKLLPPGAVSAEIFSFRTLDLYTITTGTPNYRFLGFNEDLKTMTPVQMDQYGFITGDTASLCFEKPTHTIRVFITGGSAAYGSLQTRFLFPEATYPAGTYCYQASIAGYLKKNLEKKYPGWNFEVVNAAIVMHKFNQNFAMYFEKIHDFHPDIIVNIDQFNDNNSAMDFSHGQQAGDPYLDAEKQGGEALNIEMLKRSLKGGYTCMLLSNWLIRKDGEYENKGFWTPNKKLIHGSILENTLSPAQKSLVSRNNSFGESLPKDSFKMIESIMERNVQKQLFLVKSYEHQLALDSIHSIYVMQPILTRRIKQKKLSALEKRIYDQYQKVQPEDLRNSFDFDNLTAWSQGFDKPTKDAIVKMGNAKYFIGRYYNQYFLNDYLSPMIDSLVMSEGGSYIDINSLMADMSEKNEFYVDYCHMTPLATSS